MGARVMECDSDGAVTPLWCTGSCCPSSAPSSLEPARPGRASPRPLQPQCSGGACEEEDRRSFSEFRQCPHVGLGANSVRRKRGISLGTAEAAGLNSPLSVVALFKKCRMQPLSPPPAPPPPCASSLPAAGNSQCAESRLSHEAEASLPLPLATQSTQDRYAEPERGKDPFFGGVKLRGTTSTRVGQPPPPVALYSIANEYLFLSNRERLSRHSLSGDQGETVAAPGAATQPLVSAHRASLAGSETSCGSHTLAAAADGSKYAVDLDEGVLSSSARRFDPRPTPVQLASCGNKRLEVLVCTEMPESEGRSEGEVLKATRRESETLKEECCCDVVGRPEQHLEQPQRSSSYSQLNAFLKELQFT
ncbi:hypothetical protein cyc_07568 [Cyclospora cayetanensis]|uniref:Uncharacterized protein n=1 Tax=Cyclospora cayetanensis TaxID=88456 RepID=A0A1D3D2H4_9EIME|nr:hypothetical protein cyc_07568 [Cyclospora cayetanensis]